jgi:hypothetical protein
MSTEILERVEESNGLLWTLKCSDGVVSGRGLWWRYDNGRRRPKASETTMVPEMNKGKTCQRFKRVRG